jgi:translation initiation factor 2 alpha subunit (eIF-2alpha)
MSKSSISSLAGTSTINVDMSMHMTPFVSLSRKYQYYLTLKRDPESVFSKVSITPEQQKVLLDSIRQKMSSNPLKIRVDFALTCTQFDGIDIIKEALLTAKHRVNDENWNIEFKMIAPPNYKVEVVTHSRAEGEAKLKEALQIIKTVMKANKGQFKQKSEPMLIGSSKDEPDAAELMKKA